MAIDSYRVHSEAIILDRFKQNSPIRSPLIAVASLKNKRQRLLVAVWIVCGPVVDNTNLEFVEHYDLLNVELHYVLIVVGLIGHLIVIDPIFCAIFELTPLN